jgi:hypothetical protein
MVIGLGDGLTGPMAVHIPDLEVLEMAAEGAVIGSHGTNSTDWASTGYSWVTSPP